MLRNNTREFKFQLGVQDGLSYFHLELYKDDKKKEATLSLSLDSGRIRFPKDTVDNTIGFIDVLVEEFEKTYSSEEESRARSNLRPISLGNNEHLLTTFYQANEDSSKIVMGVNMLNVGEVYVSLDDNTSRAKSAKNDSIVLGAAIVSSLKSIKRYLERVSSGEIV